MYQDGGNNDKTKQRSNVECSVRVGADKTYSSQRETTNNENRLSKMAGNSVTRMGVPVLSILHSIFVLYTSINSLQASNFLSCYRLIDVILYHDFLG
jgi:hypothetical protein